MYCKKIALLFFIMIGCCLTGSESCSVDEVAWFVRTKLYKNSNKRSQIHFNKLGDHFIVEFMGCDKNLTNLTVEKLEKVLNQAVKESGATILTIKSFAFPPMPWVGITSVAVLQESHISVHTWPQHGYIAIDIFTCGIHVYIERALEVLQQFFEPEHVSSLKLDRGFLRKPWNFDSR